MAAKYPAEVLALEATFAAFEFGLVSTATVLSLLDQVFNGNNGLILDFLDWIGSGRLPILSMGKLDELRGLIRNRTPVRIYTPQDIITGIFVELQEGVLGISAGDIGTFMRSEINSREWTQFINRIKNHPDVIELIGRLILLLGSGPNRPPNAEAIDRVRRMKIDSGYSPNPYSGKYDPPEHKSQPGFNDPVSQPGVSETDTGPYDLPTPVSVETLTPILVRLIALDVLNEILERVKTKANVVKIIDWELFTQDFQMYMQAVNLMLNQFSTYNANKICQLIDNYILKFLGANGVNTREIRRRFGLIVGYDNAAHVRYPPPLQPINRIQPPADPREDSTRRRLVPIPEVMVDIPIDEAQPLLPPQFIEPPEPDIFWDRFARFVLAPYTAAIIGRGLVITVAGIIIDGIYTLIPGGNSIGPNYDGPVDSIIKQPPQPVQPPSDSEDPYYVGYRLYDRTPSSQPTELVFYNPWKKRSNHSDHILVVLNSDQPFKDSEVRAFFVFLQARHDGTKLKSFLRQLAMGVGDSDLLGVYMLEEKN